MNKAQSFKAIHGRAPIAGHDYDRDGELCQDDHDYLSGSGQYSDEPAAPSVWEGYVLNVLLDRRLGSKPKPYYESMIRTVAIALSEAETIGFAAQLGEIHPELCAAVDSFLSGKLKPGKRRKE